MEKKTKLTQSMRAKEAETFKKFDPLVTAAQCIADLKALYNENPLLEMTRDFYRLNGSYSERNWLKHFGSWNTFKERAELYPNKMLRRVNTATAHQAHLDIYREFFNEQVLPCHDRFKASPRDPRYPELAVCSDIHDVHADPFILSAFIRMCEIRQPDHIVLNGDIFDNYEATTKYNVDFRSWMPQKRFSFVNKHVFAALRKACPKAEMTLVPGNHELRALQRLATLDPFTRAWLSDCLGLTLSDWFGLEEHRINLECKFDLGAFYKHEATETLTENYKKYYDSWVAFHTHDDGFGMAGSSGHTHRPGLVSHHSEPMGTYDWMTTGCIKDTRAEYVTGKNKWTNGFGYVRIDTKTRSANQELINIHGDFVVIDGHRFTRTATGSRLE